MKNSDLRILITSSIKAFANGDLSENTLAFFAALGYTSPIRYPLPEKTAEGLISNFLRPEQVLHPEKALLQDWKYVDFLFQITKDEINLQSNLFQSGKPSLTNIESYLFFIIQLTGESYTRTQLAGITRELNRHFAMPVFILFQYGGMLTLSIIHRRIGKRDTTLRVLEKVTQFKDISITNPHRAHIEILSDLALSSLQGKYVIASFLDLHNAWRKTLDVRELNKRFFKELFNWYLWAVKLVRFPNSLSTSSDDSMHNAEAVIRLLTRLIFVWFIKEKDLVPESLFQLRDLQELLKDFNPYSETESKYYRAILQNLFFATLNTAMDEDVTSTNPEDKRGFFRKSSFKVNNQYLDHTKYRYEEYFYEPAAAMAAFAKVPFVNGGLFECLDYPDARYDGFSTKKDRMAFIPDVLFFADETPLDLSEDYGTKGSVYRVRGLIPLLSAYKFTIVENTPIEEEIALDPELLGKVFENLLAGFNPETKSTARKQTGSFYTPREIVEFMTDQAIIQYLKPVLTETEDAEEKLSEVLSYSDTQNPFDDMQTSALVNAIADCKILDPACGSGAFPMGILHRLVHILGKLDPDNRYWYEHQKRRAQDEASATFELADKLEREELLREINEAFDLTKNSDNYARKLFLIENCIYGIDIQQIAIQISKLRFFISLISDQKVDNSKPNRNIISLPNLETKFVAADALIPLDNALTNFIRSSDIEKIEEDLKNIRHRIFFTRQYSKKKQLKMREAAKREELKKALGKNGFPQQTAEAVASWNPFDPIHSASFFDSDVMFGFNAGFDIVIGNPPYIQLQKDGGKLANTYKDYGYKTFERTGDIYAIFYERGLGMLKHGGHLCYITSNKWMRSGYGKSLRKFLSIRNPLLLIDLGPGIFESATVDTNILLIENSKNKNSLNGLSLQTSLEETRLLELVHSASVRMKIPTEDAWYIGNSSEVTLREKMDKYGTPLKDWDISIYRGILTGLNEAFIIDTPTKERICAEDPNSAEVIKPILRGKDIKRFKYNWAGLWVLATGFSINVPKEFPVIYKHLKKYEIQAKNRKDQGKDWWNLRACAYYDEFEKEKVVWKALSLNSAFTVVPTGFYNNDKANLLTSSTVDLYALCGILNSKIFDWQFQGIGINMGSGYEYKIQYLNMCRIPAITSDNRKIWDEISNLVRIRIVSQNDAEQIELEHLIDGHVADYFNLSTAEAALVGI